MISLEARKLSFGYQSGPQILENWSESFHEGELVSIVGKSGQGKSTVLYILGLMLRPQSGHVIIQGDPAGKNDSARARLRATKFGFVFQDASLDASRSVIDNVLEGALYRGDDMSMARATATKLLKQLEVDVDPDRKPGQVSGGQAQRIALSRALLGNPPIILADEPTGNLDAQSAEAVLSSFQERADMGATVIVVTHDLSIVERCDRSIRL